MRRLPDPASLLVPAFAAALFVLVAPAADAQGAPPAGGTPDPAAIAAQQLDLGAQWFRARCGECHDKGDLNNANFQVKWSGLSAYDLYDIIQRTMPEDEPGGLTPGTYTAIVAYLMKLNGMPVGTVALSSHPDSLRAVKLSFSRAASAARAAPAHRSSTVSALPSPR